MIEESRLILNEIQNKLNKSDLQYGTFIKLKYTTNLCFRVMSEAMQYSTSFNELNINKFFLKRDEAITDFNMLANKLVEYEKNNLEKNTIKNRIMLK